METGKRKRGRSTSDSKQSSEFEFNDFDFNDRILHLHIIPNGDNSESKVKILNISSPILAAKSPFFYKLLRNGMRESQKKNDLSLSINEQEEGPLMDLINFMHENGLKATSSVDLVDVLILADKFEVNSCIRYCVDSLLKLFMSRESALSYLSVPSCVMVNEIVRPLMDASNRYLVEYYKDDFTEFKDEEATELPLSVIEMFLGREGLQVDSEDDVFDFILKWARECYPNIKERREIITKHLVQLICFPNLSPSKLKDAQEFPDFDQKQVSKLVMKALFYKAEHPIGNHIHTSSQDLAITNCSFLGRVYSPRCIVDFNIEKAKLKDLTPSIGVLSKKFYLGGTQLNLYAHYHPLEEQHYLGLFMYKVQGREGAESCSVSYQFAVKSKSSMEYQIKWTEEVNFERGAGIHNLLGITWDELMSDDNDYFINDVLHLRAQITFHNS